MSRRMLVGLSLLLATGSLFALLLTMPSRSTASGVEQVEAQIAPANWYSVTVDSAGRVGTWTSLALDASGFPHISYYDDTNSALKYAHFNGSFSETAWRFGRAESHGGSWQIETADSDLFVGLYTSLALDANDHPHISYYDATNNDLRYAYGTPAYQVFLPIVLRNH